MIKRLLLLLLCLPLGLIAWSELGDLLAAWPLQAPAVEPAATAQANAATPNDADAVKKVVLTLDDPEGDPTAPEWVKALAAHGEVRHKGRQVADTERARQQVLRDRILTRMTALLADAESGNDRAQEINDLESKARAYGVGPARDELVARSLVILVDWLRVDNEYPPHALEELDRKLASWTPDGPRPDSRRPAVEAYNRFLRAHATAGPELPPRGAAELVGAPALTGEADRRAARWDLTERLAAVLAERSRGTSWEWRLDQLREAVDLGARANGPGAERVWSSARRAYLEICRSLVPELASGEPAAAAAIQAVNARRAGMTEWNEAQIQQLLATCRQYREALEGGGVADGKELIPRLEGLLKIVAGRPGLFAAAPAAPRGAGLP